MKTIEIEVLSETINCPVIQFPGRGFPGIVIQGDSLKILHELTEEIVSLTKETADDELKETLAQLNDILFGYLKNYEAVMRNSGRKLPYFIKNQEKNE